MFVINKRFLFEFLSNAKVLIFNIIPRVTEIQLDIDHPTNYVP